jgi:hypothetical protein
MRRFQSIPILALVGAAFVLGQATAQEQGDPPAQGWMQKGEPHRLMAESVGEFDVSGELWMGPGGPPMPYRATAKRELVLGGNFIKETFRGSWAGQPFEGWLLSGYDTVRKRHCNIWMDNFSPVPSFSFGGEVDGKRVFEGEDPNPLTGKLTKTWSTLETDENDKTVMSTYWVLPDGSKQMHMRLTYTRKKSD